MFWFVIVTQNREKDTLETDFMTLPQQSLPTAGSTISSEKYTKYEKKIIQNLYKNDNL